jgi:hypothetical protein
MAVHRIEAEPETFGAAAYLIIVHFVRNLAARDAKSKRDLAEMLEMAAKDAEKLGDRFGCDTTALIRRVLPMKPLTDPKRKH